MKEKDFIISILNKDLQVQCSFVGEKNVSDITDSIINGDVTFKHAEGGAWLDFESMITIISGAVTIVAGLLVIYNEYRRLKEKPPTPVELKIYYLEKNTKPKEVSDELLSKLCESVPLELEIRAEDILKADEK